MNGNLKEIASLFFKLGCIAFGGPAAHIAMMHKEVVEKRKWMTDGHFLDLISATNLIPGPNSTEMTMHSGFERGGWKGLFVAGICFIFPATVITGFLAYFYKTYGSLPEVLPFIEGIKPAVIPMILYAIFKLGKKSLKNIHLIGLCILTIIIAALGVNEILALLIVGVFGVIYFVLKEQVNQKTLSITPIIGVALLGKNLKVFLSFLKVGAILYGSGYVLFAYLDAELVASGIMERSTLIDAIAVGQLTPGPILSTATFIGYQLAGFWGAILATVGMFLPSFLFVFLLNPLLPKMRESKILSFFLDSVNAAAIAIMLYVSFEMGQEVLTNWWTVLIFILSFFIIFKLPKISPIYVIIGAGILGILFSMI